MPDYFFCDKGKNSRLVSHGDFEEFSPVVTDKKNECLSTFTASSIGMTQQSPRCFVLSKDSSHETFSSWRNMPSSESLIIDAQTKKVRISIWILYSFVSTILVYTDLSKKRKSVLCYNRYMIILGLQNVDKKYEKTRHNAGAIVLKYLIEKNGNLFELDKYTNSFKANFSQEAFSCPVYLPKTFMNLSGESAQKIIKKEDVDVKDLFVFFDDATIPVGKFKISVGEGASSHNGIKSIIENLGVNNKNNNDFTRVRIGVGKIIRDEDGKEKLYEPGPEKFSDFVLSNLNNLEIAQIQGLAEQIISTLDDPRGSSKVSP